MKKRILVNENRWYVYNHFDPETKEIVYVGHGTLGRAWDVSRNRNQHHAHQDWLYDLTTKGYIPTEWVEVLERNLSKEYARELEKEYLQSRTYKFNRQRGEQNYQAKLTDTQAQEIFLRLQKEELPRHLATEFGVSTAVIYHIKNRTQWRAVTACLVSKMI